MKKILELLRLKKESPRQKYLKTSLRTLLFIAVFLAGYLMAKLETLF